MNAVRTAAGPHGTDRPRRRTPRLRPALAGVTGLLVAALVAGAVGAAFTPAAADPATSASRSVLALGDSIPAGYDCPGCTPFPTLLGAALSTAGSTVPVRNLGVGGWTSTDLLTSVTAGSASSGPTDTDIAHSDVITVTIGANDYNTGLDEIATGTCGGPDDLDCVAGVDAQVATNLGGVLDKITALRDGAPTTVVVTGYWDVFPGGGVALSRYGPAFVATSAVLTARANAVIAATAAAHGDTYVDLGAALGAAEQPAGDVTPLLTSDGDHLDQAGDAVAAQAITAAVDALDQTALAG